MEWTPTKPFDWNYLTVQGKGVYVGDTLALFNRALLPHPNGNRDMVGEGDEKIVVDRETFPSSFGTGTEDYYGYSWGVGGTFSAPFHSMPRGDANGNYTKPGHTTNTRVRSLDRIPFKSICRSIWNCSIGRRRRKLIMRQPLTGTPWTVQPATASSHPERARQDR